MTTLSHTIPVEAASTQALTFSGRGSEYFRIWIVNLLLSVITLGIYSAWAKVRSLRYFYDNTTLAGSSFDYHGSPIAILKGRLIAVAMLFSYQFVFSFDPVLGLVLLLAFLLVAPWLIWRSLQFKLHNSSYRGIRFGFRGNARGVYKVFLLLPLLSVFTACLMAPFTHQRIKRFQHSESRFGSTYFSFHASAGGFYKAYLTYFGIFFLIASVVIVFLDNFAYEISRWLPSMPRDTLFFVMIVIPTYLGIFGIFLLYPLFTAMLQNLIWNHTRLGEHTFRSKMRWTRVLFILLTNTLGIILTLGLFTPFARIRSLRYRIESMSMQPAGSLDTFIADSTPSGSATSEGMADMLDFGLSL